VGYKYGDLAFQIGKVSDETVKYDHELCGTRTLERLLWQGPETIVQVNYRSILSSERAPDMKKPAIVRQKKQSGHKFKMGAKTDWQTGRR
jgi:hypothetical protein